MAEETVVEGTPVDWEAKARETGWAPKEQFRGDPEKWIDAETWAKRGEEFIPLLKTANRELRSQIDAMNGKLEQQGRMLNAASKALEELKTESLEQNTEQLAGRKNELMNAIAEAHSAGEIRRELELRDELADVNESIRGMKRPAQPQVQPSTEGGNGVDHTQNPIFQQFLKDNPWFGHDAMMSDAALGLLNRMNASGESARMTPSERFDRVAKEIKARFGYSENPRRNSPNRVEGGGGPGGGSVGSGKDYESLPPEAKQSCDRIATRFVGKANAKGEVRFKSLSEYRAHYAKDYFAEDWGVRHLTQ